METYTITLTGPQMALALSAVEYAYKHALRGSTLLHTMNKDKHHQNKKTATQYLELLQHLEKTQSERK